MHAQTIEATDWWARPRGATSANWIANYQRSVPARHRTAIAAIVQALQAESLLEVGCHCGPNLVRLAQQRDPALQLTGIDANAEAVAAGQAWVAAQGYGDRIQLQVGRCPAATQGLASGCVDVVLSCYTLAYVAPADLDAALYELGRLATRAVVIAEPMGRGPTPTRALSGYSEWTHDYQEATQWIGSLAGMTTRIVPIVPPVDKLNAILVLTRDDGAR